MFSAFFLITKHKYLVKWEIRLALGPQECQEAFFNLICSVPHIASWICVYLLPFARETGELLQIDIHMWKLRANIWSLKKANSRVKELAISGVIFKLGEPPGDPALVSSDAWGDGLQALAFASVTPGETLFGNCRPLGGFLVDNTNATPSLVNASTCPRCTPL